MSADRESLKIIQILPTPDGCVVNAPRIRPSDWDTPHYHARPLCLALVEHYEYGETDGTRSVVPVDFDGWLNDDLSLEDAHWGDCPIYTGGECTRDHVRPPRKAVSK